MNNEYYSGLNNHGNTCFFNSAFQSILRCSVFMNFILNLNCNNELIVLLKEFINEYKKNSNLSVSPIKLVQHYTNLNKKYKIGSQDDADEVINYFIGEIDDVIKKEIKEGRCENIIIKGDITLDRMIDYLFGIRIKTVVKCLKCSNISTKETTEYKLSVGLNSDDKLSNLDDYIKNFTSIEELNGDNKYYCDNCKDYVDALKSDKIIKTPKYLHIHLKRFEHGHRRSTKISKDIKINSIIKMCDNNYQLRGCVYHMGSIAGGHYIYYYNKNKNNNYDDWICLDDSRISTKNISSEINSGYIYLYVK
jgi:ubiquitin C-terminal hydrolase